MESSPKERTTENDSGNAEKQKGAIGRIQRWLRTGILGSALLAMGSDSTLERRDGPSSAPFAAATAREKTQLPGTYAEEQCSNHSLTVDGYLSLLAQKLCTPEALHRFLRERMRYVAEERGADHWQSPTETVLRAENGRMYGDCEDYAFLAREILRRQGKNAHVVTPPGHAVCVWAERRNDGKYNAFTADELGVDRNAALQEHIRNGTPRPHLAPDGYATIIDAVNAVLRKYEGDGTPDFQVHPYWIPVLRKCGSVQYCDVVAVHAFDPDLPDIARISGIELASLIALLGGGYGTYRFLRRRRGEKETWKDYFTTFRLH